jgi:hypothetical protein
MSNTIFQKAQGFIPKTISVDQAKDTGMAMVLICLLIAFFSQKKLFNDIAMLLLLINMILPNIYKPLAKLWFGLSYLLGTVMSKVILSVVFFGLILPVGLFRRLLGKDSLQLKKWKKGHDSVYKVRDHQFVSEDIIHPY